MIMRHSDIHFYSNHQESSKVGVPVMGTLELHILREWIINHTVCESYLSEVITEKRKRNESRVPIQSSKPTVLRDSFSCKLEKPIA